MSGANRHIQDMISTGQTPTQALASAYERFVRGTPTKDQKGKKGTASPMTRGQIFAGTKPHDKSDPAY